MSADTTPRGEAIGTVAWAHRTGGRLTPAQALGYALTQIDQQRHRLRQQQHHRQTSHRAGIEPAIPDTDVAIEVSNYAAEHLPTPILHHSWRVWLWAHELQSSDDRPDPDLLLAACLLHDTGLADRTGKCRRDCFTVRSADIAIGILDRVGLDAAASDAVAAAIIGHMNVVPPTDAGPLTRVLHAATHFDVAGARAHRIPVGMLAAAHRRYPRDGFTRCFSRSFRGEFVHAPLTRAGIAWAIGLPLVMRLNPIRRTITLPQKETSAP